MDNYLHGAVKDPTRHWRRSIESSSQMSGKLSTPSTTSIHCHCSVQIMPHCCPRRMIATLPSAGSTIARQESRILWLREGDASTHFFHSCANARRRRNHIHSLEGDGRVFVKESSKAEAIRSFFDNILGIAPEPTNYVNLAALELPRANLSELGSRFTEDEIWKIIRALPVDKALGLDGFMARLLQWCWDIIRPEIMRPFDALWWLDTRDLHSVNEPLMVLLPKALEAKAIKDYRPISLIHVMGKLVTKVLASRLSSRMGELIRPCQSAFISGRIIQDNFWTIQASAKPLHVRRRPCLLMKMDIARAFDSVSWPFLLEILRYMGFPHYWLNWVSVLLASASAKVLLNGCPGHRICHTRGAPARRPSFTVPLHSSHGGARSYDQKGG
jgi:hypothetical protein